MSDFNYKSKSVDFFKLSFASRKIDPLKKGKVITFCDLLHNPEISDIAYKIPGEKCQRLTVLVNTPEYTIGVIKTTLLRGIPPKYDYLNDQAQSLELGKNEGLGYANTFLYYKAKEVLLYEFNKNGCYPSALKDLIRFIAGTLYPNTGVALEFFPILTKNAYEQYLKMRNYLSLECSIATPTQLLNKAEEEHQENDALTSISKESRDLNAVSSTIIFKGDTKSGGLSPQNTRNLIEKFFAKPNTQKIIIKGYSEDPEDKKQHELDLIAGLLKGCMRLKEPKVLSNFLLQERTMAIKTVFEENKATVDSVI